MVEIWERKYSEKYDYWSNYLQDRIRCTEKDVCEKILDKAKTHNKQIKFDSRYDRIVVHKGITTFFIKCTIKQFNRLQNKYGDV